MTKPQKTSYAVIARLAAVVALSVGVVGSAVATPASTPVGKITALNGGWSDPNLRIYVSVPVHNPEGCADTTSYVIPANLPANQQLTALALTAYSMDHRASFTIDGCAYSSPRVIAITIQK
jgi:hypothetical protein